MANGENERHYIQSVLGRARCYLVKTERARIYLQLMHFSLIAPFVIVLPLS